MRLGYRFFKVLGFVEYIVDDAILDGHDYTSLYVKYTG
jgi:hypothetical protein